MQRNKISKFTVADLPREAALKLVYPVHNHFGNEIREQERKVTETRSMARVLGKLCPCCGVVGSVLYETETRIIYESPNRHQYETKKRLDRISG